ncbi:MAG: DNA adenine methylase [Christensenellaceae bacterium]
MVARQMSPVLKWAGGKTQLLAQITARMPKTYNRYYEPFIGGGAVWLAVTPEQAVINDTNEQLINLYRQMKENAHDVIAFVNELDSVPCFNGLYRVNRKGLFNVLHNNRTGIKSCIKKAA